MEPNPEGYVRFPWEEEGGMDRAQYKEWLLGPRLLLQPQSMVTCICLMCRGPLKAALNHEYL